MKKAIRNMSLFFNQRLLICLFVVSTQMQSAWSEDGIHYISPRLQLGIHTEASMDSPISALISSGTAVEVKKTEKAFSEIRTEDGAQGWIKSKFLTQDKPAELLVKELEQALNTAQKSLEEAQAESNNLSNEGASDFGTERLSDSQKSDYEQTIKELKAEITAWEQLDSEDKKAQQVEAQRMSQHLKERLAKIAVLATGQESSADLANLHNVEFQSDDVDQTFLSLFKKDYLFNLVIGGICFFLGIFLMDLINRRRHGGYRI